MSQRTILLLITNFDIGGAERVYTQLAQGLATRGYRVITACLQWRSGAVARELGDPRIEIVNLKMTSKLDIGAFVRLLRLLRRNHVDVVYTFLIHPHLLGRLAARLAGVPILISSQQTMLYESRLLEWANRLTASWCAAIVAVSRNVEEYLAQHVGLPRAKLVTIYNSVEMGRFDKVSPRQSEQSASGPRIGCCARLTPEKDHQTLIASIKLVKQRLPGTQLLLAGEGPERARLMRLVEAERLDSTVHFLGHVDDVASFYSHLDIYVQSSYIEGLPCAILEALACSLPVVASRAGGNEEIVIDGEAGLLVTPRDPAALADAIMWMATHPEEARRMGTNGRRIVEERFSAPAMIAATDQLISRLAAVRMRG